MHFEIKEFSSEKKTGFTRITISYNLGKLTEIDQRGFDTPEKATNYCNSMRRDWLKIMLEKYVKHSKTIFETSKNLGYYNETERLNSLTRCINAVQIVASENNINVVASYIASAERLLKHILPHPHNNSFSSSEERLNTMQQIAKQYLIANKKKITA